MVMRSVTEEKTNRAEILVTTVKPFQLMLGKILGIGAVGLTQFLLWGVFTFLINTMVTMFLGDKIIAMQALQHKYRCFNG